MISRELVDKSVFSIKLNRDVNQPTGELLLGGSDPSLYKGNISYVRLSGRDQWKIRMDDVLVNDVSFSSTNLAVIDSGLYKIHVPYRSFENLHRTIGTNGRDEFDCSIFSSLPDVKLIVGGITFTLKPEDYVDINNGSCFSLFRQSQSYDNYWGLGVIFLRKSYTEFDIENERIGFAENA